MQEKTTQNNIGPQSHHLPRNFILAGLACIFMVVVVLGTLTYNAAISNLVDVAEDRNVTIARVLYHHVWKDYADDLQKLVLQSPVSAKDSSAYRRMREAVDKHVHGAAITKVKIYSVDALTLFSTDASQLAEVKQASQNIKRALSGEIVTKKVFGDQAYTKEESLHNIYQLSTYVPVYKEEYNEGRVIAGVMEVYSEVSALHHQIISTRNNIIISITLVLLLVFAVLFVFVRRAATMTADRLQEKLNDEAQMHHIAYHDALTELPNREMFRQKLESAIARCARSELLLAVIFLDLDRFKHINDTLGHGAGDLLLKEVAVRLSACVRQTDTVGRQGGDEFTLLLDGITHVEEVEVVANRILTSLNMPVTINNHEFIISASMGISIYPFDEREVDNLLEDADAAMYAAKAAGRNNYVFFTSEMAQGDSGNLEMENKLRTALAENEYLLQYQPIVDVRKGQMMGVEALLRWKSDEYGIVPPYKFIPILEETGFITIVGKWVLLTACKKAVEWQQMGYEPMTMSVNISVVQFRRLQFVDSVRDALVESGLDPKYLKIEITESVIMDQNDASVKKLEAIRELGVSIAADDFGTGYSSLSYLKKLPIDILKIDRSFVTDIHKTQDGAAIATAIAALAHSLKLGIIAEGVEEIEELNFLVALSCNYIQGYFFSKPLFEDDLLAVMDDKDYFINKLIAAREQNQAALG
jgi:diguanylate cyclase (GGDEF)-like protein